MKKSSFVQGAFVATSAIIITKILGVLYVIPFYHIIGEENGGLYGRAYVVYNLFLMLSAVGLPLATSKLISEYNALGYNFSKEKAYKLGRNFVLVMSVVMFGVLMAFAPSIASWMMRGVTGAGADSISDIAFTIRVISSAILIAPLLGIVRGYLQGHKYIDPTAYSQIIEQVVRVIVILAGSYALLNVFNLPMIYAIGISLFAATIGACASLLYLLLKVHKNRKALNRDSLITRDEKDITNKVLLKKLLIYAVPFILLSITVSIYEFIDIATIESTLTGTLGYSATDSKTIVAVLTTWGNKLNTIVSSIGIGLTVSLIPNITGSYLKKNYVDVRRKINQTLQVVLFVALPLAVLLSILAVPVFDAFYGTTTWGPDVFRFSVFIALFSTLFYTSTVMLQMLNKYKMVLISLFCGVLLNALLKIPLMLAVSHLGFHGVYGAIIATWIGYSLSIIISLSLLSKFIKVSYLDTFNKLLKIAFGVLVMAICLILMQIAIPLEAASRFMSIVICALYSFVGLGIYLFICHKNGAMKDIVGEKFIGRLLVRFKLKKVKT